MRIGRKIDDVSLQAFVRTLAFPFLAFWLRSSGGSDGKRLSTMWETWVRSLGWEVLWRRKCQPTPVLLPRNPMDGGAWCPWGRKELDTTERLQFSFFLPFLFSFIYFFVLLLRKFEGVYPEFKTDDIL